MVADDQEGKGVFDAPVHGNSGESADKAKARVDAAGLPDLATPSMTHELEGTSILVKNESGVGGAEATTLTHIDDADHSGQTGGKSA